MRARWLLLLTFFPSLFAQTKHPFTFEDMMALKRVEEPEVSPDGKWVLFAAVDVDLKANTKTPHVWVVPLGAGATTAKAGSSTSSGMTEEGVAHTSPGLASVGDGTAKAGSRSTPSQSSVAQGRLSTPQDHSEANDPATVGVTAEKQIISDQDADRPRWAPDGKRFAFVSTKEKGSQIWIADFDRATGTVTAKYRLTDVPTEADGELWSPDGKYILFKSDVYSECVGTAAVEAACNKKRVEEAKESKVKAQIFTHLLYRHWNAYKEGKRTHLFVVPVVPADRFGWGVGAGHPAGPESGEGAPHTQSTEARQSHDINPKAGSSTPPDHSRANDPAPVGTTESTEREVTLLSIARDLTPGDYDAPVFSLGGQDDYALSPDGKELCYASNHDAMPAASTNNDLFTVPVNWPVDATSAQVIAATKNITAENKAADNTPLYSPDGKYIAYRAQSRPGYESDRFRLMLYDRKTGEKVNATASWDRWVGTLAWTQDSQTLYFTAETGGSSPVYKIRVAEGYRGTVNSDPLEVVAGFNDNLTLTPTGDTLLFTHMSLSAPDEIYQAATSYGMCEIYWDEKRMPKGPLYERAKCQTSQASAFSHLNDSVLSQVSMSPLESFWFTGANNDKVQGFVVKPPHFDPNKKYPVKFLIHGGPEGAWGDDWSYRWNPELFAANGYVVIMINFHGSTGYGQKFIDAINGDWGGAPFGDLMKGLDYAEQHYPFIDKDRECALGASYGGYMANWILGHTNRFKCIVTHDGMFNTESAWGDTEELWFNEWEFKGTPYINREMYRKWSPHLSAANFKTPTLVIHGQLDYRLDVSQGFDLFTTSQRQGVPSKMLYFPDEGHWVLKPQNSQLWYKTVNDWVDQWTKPVGSGQ